MRRAQAILAIVTLLVVPLTPLAWGMACEASSASVMCPLMASSHSQPGQRAICHCPVKSGKQSPDVGLLAPIPLATPSERVQIISPEDARRAFFSISQSAAPGFLAAPFEPPRA
jgi:hypothetical protein